MSSHSYIHNNSLIVTHNAGLFSCCSVKLSEIINFFNTYKQLPSNIINDFLFDAYKPHSAYNINNDLYENASKIVIEYKNNIDFHHDHQFIPYNTLDFNQLIPFIEKYFTASKKVKDYTNKLELRYSIDYLNTAAVYYRGNDKCQETGIASYDVFFDKCKKIYEENNDIRFLVQTDELEFKDEFCKRFSNSFFINEIPMISKNKNMVIHKLVLPDHRPEFAIRILSMTQVIAKCKHLITHTGNCGLWAVLYRGNSNNVHQFLKATQQTTEGKWV
jgi:hypothetical protein